MEITYQFEIADAQNNSKTPLKDGNKKWVAFDDLNNEKIMSILEKVFEKAECCKEDTLWYDSITTLADMIVIEFEKELKGDTQ